jgi:putative FmdB family regulatory protein
MPTYSFRCKSCDKVFDEICQHADIEGVRCECCAGGELERLMTAPRAVIFMQPRGTSREDNFDYVVQWNHDKAVKERKRAEEREGFSNPYNPIDDISSGEYFGEVK